MAAVRPDAVPATPAANRVVRHPQIRKGQVLLDLCTPDQTLTRTTITKRHGPLYRQARDIQWGDPFSGGAPPGRIKASRSGGRRGSRGRRGWR